MPIKDKALAVATPAMPAPVMTMVLGVMSEERVSAEAEEDEVGEEEVDADTVVVEGARRRG